jgi:transposase
MSLATADLPDDPTALRAFALACQGELRAAQTAVQLKALEIEKLRFQIAKLRRMQFGRSSERITRQIEQLELQLEELETGEAEDEARAEANDPEAPAPVRKKPKRKPLPDHLPRQEVLHQPEGDSACVCPACGGGMGKLGEDVTEVLDYVPGHFQVIRHVRPKYACQAYDAITQAPAPAMPTPRGRATPATLAHLLVSKYCDHLPLYRQCEIYAQRTALAPRIAEGSQDRWHGPHYASQCDAGRAPRKLPELSPAVAARCAQLCWARAPSPKHSLSSFIWAGHRFVSPDMWAHRLQQPCYGIGVTTLLTLLQLSEGASSS